MKKGLYKILGLQINTPGRGQKISITRLDESRSDLPSELDVDVSKDEVELLRQRIMAINPNGMADFENAKVRVTLDNDSRIIEMLPFNTPRDAAQMLVHEVKHRSRH